MRVMLSLAASTFAASTRLYVKPSFSASFCAAAIPSAPDIMSGSSDWPLLPKICIAAVARSAGFSILLIFSAMAANA
jgi:hypothetical protein